MPFQVIDKTTGLKRDMTTPELAAIKATVAASLGMTVTEADGLRPLVSGYGNTSFPFRAPQHPNVYGNAGVIDAIKADQALWHLWMFGDSRTAGIGNSKFLARAPAGTPIGGFQAAGQTSISPSGIESGQVSYSADALGSSPHLGYPIGPLVRYEFKTAVATTPGASNTISRRMTYSSNTVLSTYAAMWGRLIAGRRSFIKGVSRLSSGAWSSGAANMPTIHIHARPSAGAGTTGDAGYMVSQPVPVYWPDGVAYSVGCISVPSSFDWATNPAPDLGWVVQGGVAVATAGKIAVVSAPWVEMSTGMIFREVGCVSGRSIAALQNEETLPISFWREQVLAVGGKPVLWLEIGTNNTPSYSQATFRQQMELIIARFRAGVGDPAAPVILVTAYPASTDSGAPYYVLAARELAQADNAVVCLDTWAQLPSYAAGVTAGYYSDTVHYNGTGNDAFADAYWALWGAA